MRDLARRSGLDLIEVNLERDPTLRRHFASNDPKVILGELSLALNRTIRPESCILFLDLPTGCPWEENRRDNPRKALLADVGLLHAIVGTPAADSFPDWSSLPPGVRGQLTDQLGGQQLRLVGTGSGDGPDLFFWKREGGRPGEVDYVAQAEGRIVPLELKAGAAGSMKSLHQFMFDKRLGLAVRSDANAPSVQDLDVRTTRGDDVRYRLVNIPLYLVWNLAPIVASASPR